MWIALKSNAVTNGHLKCVKLLNFKLTILIKIKNSLKYPGGFSAYEVLKGEIKGKDKT